METSRLFANFPLLFILYRILKVKFRDWRKKVLIRQNADLFHLCIEHLLYLGLGNFQSNLGHFIILKLFSQSIFNVMISLWGEWVRRKISLPQQTRNVSSS